MYAIYNIYNEIYLYDILSTTTLQVCKNSLGVKTELLPMLLEAHTWRIKAALYVCITEELSTTVFLILK